VDALLDNGAHAGKAGAVSGCTALHAAAAAGHTEVCLRLLAKGASVGALSAAGKRTALHLACARGHVATATALVEVGGADPYLCESHGGGESTMGLLRRMGSPEALGLLAVLDGLCGARMVVEGTSAADKTRDAPGPEAEPDEAVDDELRYEEGIESDDEGDRSGDDGSDDGEDDDESGEE